MTLLRKNSWLCALILTMAAFFFPFCVPQVAKADDQSDTQALRDAVNKSWTERIRPAFIRSHPELKAVIQNTQFKIIDYTDFNAWAGRDNSISFPIGYLLTLDHIADGMVMALTVGGDCPQQFAQYFEEIRNSYVANLQALPTHTPRSMESRCGISDNRAARLRADGNYYNARVAMIVDSLAAVSAHELGHIVLNHKPCMSIAPSDSRRQETEADDFGFQLAKDAGFNPLAALATTYSFFSELEGLKFDASTHPRASCRLTRQYERLIKGQGNEESEEKNLAKAGMSLAQFNELLDQLKQDCAD